MKIAVPYEERSVWRRIAADFFDSRIATAGLLIISIACLMAVFAGWILNGIMNGDIVWKSLGEFKPVFLAAVDEILIKC